ncbi:YgjP-like metallopeptidase domain-containing protein [Herbaspirillum chlorophenolicum]|uniref:YgjP-like metallopeptidase domain-containing protein n=1 Tax=Herbaspirillum chlorophenolicum TaxID=211589 RepID=A0ABW8EVI6_9BURK|nr:SprT family zinc-dependent metalloprotease [Herbaspirillum chlorophenolicum]
MKLLRKPKPNPNQLSLQLDLFAPEPEQGQSPAQQISPIQDPGPALPSPTLQPPLIVTPTPVVHAAPLPSPVVAPPTTLVPPPTSRPADGKRRIQLGEHTLDYALLRSKRSTIGFLVSDEGLRVTSPKWVTLAEIENAIREKQRWILSKLNERRERSARRLQPQMQWCDGATLPYLGADITLRIRAGQRAAVYLDEDARELNVSLPADAGEQQLKDRVQGWLQARAEELFGKRLIVYAEKLGVTYRSYALSSATTQWGSCTADGRIRLNWRLMHFALPLIDYVIAHELAHLREMNHGPQFWATVQSIFPEFEIAKKALRDSAPETLPIF